VSAPERDRELERIVAAQSVAQWREELEEELAAGGVEPKRVGS
jgi:hypothetical protein